MKKILKQAVVFCGLALAMVLFVPIAVNAKEEVIKEGVYAGDISLSGMTVEEAKEAIIEYVNSLQDVEITLIAADEQEVVVTGAELGITWANTDMVEEAITLGSQGNIVQRYKSLKDLEHENKIYPIELDFDITAIDAILAERCSKYDKPAVDMGLVLENGVFSTKEGQIGYQLDVETSIDTVYDYLVDEWDHQACAIELDVVVTQPRGTAEELLQVKDVLGSFSTGYTSSGANRSANVENGARLINGVTLYPGDEFSTHELVAPFTEKNGYYMASSYVSGKVVDSLGGGICQVSTTLYNAVLLAELEVTERHNHSMIVTYVEPSADAAIAESSGKDFRFVNNTEYPVYVESYTTANKQLVVNIYGVETREEGRTIQYVSEVLETISPSADVITVDEGQRLGIVTISSAHTGYKAKLWKVVLVDGVEISREVVNSSGYKMTPRSATVGVATTDPNAYNEIMAAIATGDITHVRNIATMLTTPQPSPEEAPAVVQ